MGEINFKILTKSYKTCLSGNYQRNYFLEVFLLTTILRARMKPFKEKFLNCSFGACFFKLKIQQSKIN